MPGLEGIAALDLDVQQDRVMLKHASEPVVDLDIKLPFPVVSDDGSATFDKDKCTLNVVLPVVKPDEKPQEALLRLEENADGEAADKAAAGEQGEIEDADIAEFVMAQEQKSLGFGMFVPPKLGQNMMF